MNFPGIGNKGKDIQGLLKASISLLGRDNDIFKPAIYITIIRSIRSLMIFYMIYSFFISEDPSKGFLLILVSFIISPIITYISIRYKAITSWMIYDILRSKDTDVSRGKKNIKGIGWSLLLYSIIEIIITSSKNSNSKNSGILRMITSLILSIFEEVWDLVKNFTLPALVIDKARLKEVPSKLKLVKKNIPGALVGILGLDIVGSVFISLFSLIQLPALLFSGALGYYIKGIFPSSWLITLPIEGGQPFIINALPIFIALIISTIFFSFLNALVALVKTTYFTTFYISLTQPEKISLELHKDVTNYLNYNNRLKGYTLFEPKVPKDEEPIELEEKTGEDLKIIRKLANTFKLNINKGAKPKAIKKALLKKDFSENQIKLGYEMYMNSKK